MSELALKLIYEAKKKNLKSLNLGNCGLTELPRELFELVWLEELVVSNEQWHEEVREEEYVSGKLRKRYKVADLLDAILPLFPIDEYVDDPLVMMACAPIDEPDPAVEADYRAAIERHAPNAPAIQFIDRFAFYERSETAFAILITGETRKYGNIILKKGVY